MPRERPPDEEAACGFSGAEVGREAEAFLGDAGEVQPAHARPDLDIGG